MKHILLAYWEALREPLLPLIAILCILLGSCGGGGGVKLPKAETPKPSTFVTEPTNDSKIEKADAKVDRLEGELKTAKEEAATERRHANEARIAGLKTLVTWLSAALILIATVAVVCAIWLQMKTLWALAAACAGGVVCAQSFSFVLDHIILASCIVVALGLAAAALVLWKHGKVAKELKAKGEGLLAAVKVAEFLKPNEETEEEAFKRRAAQRMIVTNAGPNAFKVIEDTLRGA